MIDDVMTKQKKVEKKGSETKTEMYMRMYLSVVKYISLYKVEG